MGRSWVVVVVIIAACGGSPIDDAGPSGADAGPLSASDGITFASDVPSGAYGEQTSPSLAWDGESFLAAWVTDDRRIGYTRVSAAGEAMARHDVIESDAGDPQTAPRVACHGGTCLIAWLDSATPVEPGVLRAELLDGGDQIFLTSEAWAFDVVATTAGFLASWSDDTPMTWVQSFGPDGMALAPATRVFPNDVPALAPALSCNPVACLVAAMVCPAGPCTLWRLALDADGNPPADVDGLYTAEGYAGRIATDGTGFAITYRTSSGSHVNLLRLDATGAEIAPPVELAGSSAADPQVAFDGTKYLVLLVDDLPGAYLRARRVSTGGIMDPPFDVVEAYVEFGDAPAVACGETTCLAVASRWFGGMLANEVVGARVSGGVSLDPDGVVVSRAASEQIAGGVASDGNVLALAWVEQGLAGHEVRMARVDTDGVPMDPQGVVVASTNGIEGRPRLAWDGAQYRVTYLDASTSTLFEEQVSATLAPGTTRTLASLPTGEYGFTDHGIGCNDAGRCLVAWSDGEVRAQLFDADDMVGSESVTLGTQSYFGRLPVAWRDGFFAASWIAFTPLEELNVAIVGDDAAIATPPPIVKIQLGQRDGFGWGIPSLIALDDGFLLAWRGSTGVTLRTISVDGALGPARMLPMPASQWILAAEVAPTSRDRAVLTWLVTDEDTLSIFRDTGGDSFALRIGPDGELSPDAPSFLGTFSYRLNSSLVGGGSGTGLGAGLMVRSSYDADLAFNSMRIWGQVLR